MLFPSTSLVHRIEQAEASALSTIVEACEGDTFRRTLGGGLALYRGPGSPLNKIVGVGFEPLSEEELADIEQAYLARGANVQIELSTYAEPALAHRLARRGYRHTGLENVLGRALHELPVALATDIEVCRADPGELESWVDVLATGFSSRDDGAPAAEHDAFDREALARVFRDMAQKPTLMRWLALRGGDIAGAASMSTQDGIAQLFGAATHPAHRRHGVQSALLAARLQAGRDEGCEFAVITTQPGSKSHENAQRAGFALLYARSIWVRSA